MLGGWGQAKCTAWLTGREARIREGLAMERCILSLGAMGVDFPIAGTLEQARKCVEDHLAPRGPRSRSYSANYRDIVLEAVSPYKFATESSLAERGFTADRTPTARSYGGHL